MNNKTNNIIIAGKETKTDINYEYKITAFSRTDVGSLKIKVNPVKITLGVSDNIKHYDNGCFCVGVNDIEEISKEDKDKFYKMTLSSNLL